MPPLFILSLSALVSRHLEHFQAIFNILTWTILIFSWVTCLCFQLVYLYHSSSGDKERAGRNIQALKQENSRIQKQSGRQKKVLIVNQLVVSGTMRLNTVTKGMKVCWQGRQKNSLATYDNLSRRYQFSLGNSIALFLTKKTWLLQQMTSDDC